MPKRSKGFWFSSSPKMQVNNNNTIIELHATLKASLISPIALEGIDFYVGEEIFPSELTAHYSYSEKRTEHTCKVVLKIPVEAIYDMPTHSTVRIGVPNEQKGIARLKVFYNKSSENHSALHTKFFKDKKADIVAFFRQSKALTTRFTVRHANVTDSTSKQIKLLFAWSVSKLAFWINPTLIFEKNGSHYEESGRIVFERLVDMGYKNVRFILNKEIVQNADIDQKYRSKIVLQHLFMHYLMFFRSRTFLGTEALSHALELRCQDIHFQRKLKSKLNTYVFCNMALCI